MFTAHRPHQKRGGTTVMGAVRATAAMPRTGRYTRGRVPVCRRKSVHKGTFRLFPNFSLHIPVIFRSI